MTNGRRTCFDPGLCGHLVTLFDSLNSMYTACAKTPCKYKTVLTLGAGTVSWLLLMYITPSLNNFGLRRYPIAPKSTSVANTGVVTKGGSETLSNPMVLTHKSNLNPSVKLGLNSQDDNRRVNNPHAYKLLIDEPHSCYDAKGRPRDVFLLVFIHTIHSHLQRREAIRETWSSPRAVRGKQIVTFFLMAQNPNATLQKQVEEESTRHHDLLQEDFQDTYKNLTLKTIMGIKWASTHCPHASYIMKTDDDSYVNYDNLVNHLSRAPSKQFAEGCLLGKSPPNRDPTNKWYVSKELYPGKLYPAYLSGAGYVISGDLTKKIYEKSLDIRYLFLEDVFMAECLNALRVRRRGNGLFTCWVRKYSYCTFRKLISAHRLLPADMRRIWLDQQRKVKC